MALHPTRAPLPLVVIAHEDPGTADSLRHAVEATAGWRAAVADQRPGGLSAALAASPTLALVGCGALADLPSGYRVPLLAVGDDNRPADLRAALAAGAHGLLPWPDGAADLPAELARIAAETRPSMPAEQSFVAPVIAVLGVQGGAGATTVAAHLAAAWSRYGPPPGERDCLPPHAGGSIGACRPIPGIPGSRPGSGPWRTRLGRRTRRTLAWPFGSAVGRPDRRWT